VVCSLIGMTVQIGECRPKARGLRIDRLDYGGLLGSYLRARVPVTWLRPILGAILFATAARMLWA
jgi:hypothetical protein